MPYAENCGEFCICRKNNRACTRKCRCFNCKNKMKLQIKSTPNRGCHCGITMVKKNPLYMSCKDSSNRKCKCPCVAYGAGCSDICRCFNCCNVLGRKTSEKKHSTSIPLKRKRATVSPYKRKTGADFLKSEGSTIKPGSWTEMETTFLLICKDVIESFGLETNVVNMGQLFRYIAQSEKVVDIGLQISSKSNMQIAGKMACLRKP